MMGDGAYSRRKRISARWLSKSLMMSVGMSSKQPEAYPVTSSTAMRQGPLAEVCQQSEPVARSGVPNLCDAAAKHKEHRASPVAYASARMQ